MSSDTSQVSSETKSRTRTKHKKFPTLYNITFRHLHHDVQSTQGPQLSGVCFSSAPEKFFYFPVILRTSIVAILLNTHQEILSSCQLIICCSQSEHWIRSVRLLSLENDLQYRERLVYLMARDDELSRSTSSLEYAFFFLTVINRLLFSRLISSVCHSAKRKKIDEADLCQCKLCQ